MTNQFDQYFSQIMENSDILTVSRLLDQYQSKIRRLTDANYESDPIHIEKVRGLRKQAIEEYEQFIELNHEEIVKKGLNYKILQFKQELRRIKMM